MLAAFALEFPAPVRAGAEQGDEAQGWRRAAGEVGGADPRLASKPLESSPRLARYSWPCMLGADPDPEAGGKGWFSRINKQRPMSERAKLATFGWRKGSACPRTLLEHNLPHLNWPRDDGAAPKAWQSEWARAFDKEPVTKRFFDDSNDSFRKVSNDLANRQSRGSKDTVEREAQTLLNRLLFLYFIQRKGWLNRDREYPASHFRDHYRGDPTGTSFLKEFLRPLCVKLSTKGPQAEIPGHDLPFLNGGLFADEYGTEPRDDEVRRHHELKVGNDTFRHIFDDLLEAYDFTVR